VRALVILGIVVVALVAMLAMRPASEVAVEAPALTYVTTAHQLGVVGYRDPAGAISPDGKRFAYSEGRFIRIIPIGGGAPITLPPSEGQVRSLQWTSNDTVVPVPRAPSTFRMGDGTEACLADRRIVIPCGGSKVTLDPDVDVIGPIAFAADRVYFASPGGPSTSLRASDGFVALWSADLRTKRARRLTSFARDAYAPTISQDGTVVFKVQSYRTHLADVPAEGGPTRQLTTFQSETPSFHPTRPLIAFTYGTWRRVLDDSKYPDIAQEIGVIDLPNSGEGPASAGPYDRPSEVIAQSDSEDQAMAWSPNGKWIAFHTHREMSDDVWLRPADLSAVASAKADGSQPDKRITFLGRGAEVGWPRWSPDGKTVLLNGARKSDGASVIYVIGVNQDTGEVTSALKEVAVEGIAGEMGHSEWLPGGTAIASIAKEGPGRHVIFTVPIGGGRATVLHRFASEHDFSGLGVSADGKYLAFTAPASDGYYQIFKLPVDGKAAPIQLTIDPSNKTQPAFSPDGSRVAFTVWSYDAVFWSLTDR
jgi:Tol biopolymer transport system component